MTETAELFVDISLKGNFSQGIGKAQKATRNFANETKKASTQVGKMQGAVSGLGAKLRSVTKNPELKRSVLQGVGLGGGVVGFQLLTSAISGAISVMGDSIGLASDLAESQSKVDEVFGSSADEIHDWSQTLIRDFGLTERAAEEAAGTFGNFLQAMGTTREEALDMSKGIVELGADLAAFNNVSVEDVLVSLRAGIAGEAEPMRRLGADVSAARVESILLAKGIEKLNGKFTEGQKVLGRYEAIMQDTVTAQGNFALTSGDLAGQQKILNAQLETMQTRLGELLTPGFTALVAFINDEAIPALEGFGKSLSNLALTDFDRKVVAQVEAFTEALGEGAPAASALLPLIKLNTDAALEFGIAEEQVLRALDGIIQSAYEQWLEGAARATEAAARATADAEAQTRVYTGTVGFMNMALAQATARQEAQAKAMAMAKNRADRLADGLNHVATVGFGEVRKSANEARKAIEAAFKGDDKNVKSVKQLQQERDKLEKQQRRAALDNRSQAFALASARLAEVKAQLQQRNRERRATAEFRAELKGRKKGVEEVTTTVEDLGKEAEKEKRLQIKTDHAMQNLNAVHKRLVDIRREAMRGVITLSVLKQRAATVGLKPSAGPSFGGGTQLLSSGGSTQTFSGGIAGAMRPAPVVQITNTISAYDVEGETSRVLATNRRVAV